jgi:hypothetical protein
VSLACNTGKSDPGITWSRETVEVRPHDLIVIAAEERVEACTFGALSNGE